MAPQYEREKVKKISGQNGLKGLQMVQFECPRHSNPSVSSILGDGKFSQLPKLALWGNKNGLPSMKQGNLKSTRKAHWSPFLSLYFWHKLIRRDQRQMRGKWSQNLPVPSHGTCFYTAAGGRAFCFLSLFRRDQPSDEDQLGEGHRLSKVWRHCRGGCKWADPF